MQHGADQFEALLEQGQLLDDQLIDAIKASVRGERRPADTPSGLIAMAESYLSMIERQPGALETAYFVGRISALVEAAQWMDDRFRFECRPALARCNRSAQ